MGVLSNILKTVRDGDFRYIVNIICINQRKTHVTSSKPIHNAKVPSKTPLTSFNLLTNGINFLARYDVNFHIKHKPIQQLKQKRMQKVFSFFREYCTVQRVGCQVETMELIFTICEVIPYGCQAPALQSLSKQRIIAGPF